MDLAWPVIIRATSHIRCGLQRQGLAGRTGLVVPVVPAQLPTQQADLLCCFVTSLVSRWSAFVRGALLWQNDFQISNHCTRLV